MWEGPRMRTNLKGIDPGFIMRQPMPMVQVAWRALHDQLVRQSYIMTLVYDVSPDDFGKVEANPTEEKP
jgi:mediator of RNA polymerase II transcription subunit 18